MEEGASRRYGSSPTRNLLCGVGRAEVHGPGVLTGILRRSGPGDSEAPAGSFRSQGNPSEVRARPWGGPPCLSSRQSDRISPPSPSAPSTWQSWGSERADHSSKDHRVSSHSFFPPCFGLPTVVGTGSPPSLAAHNQA